MPKFDFKKVALLCISTWVFFCKFGAYFQNTFSLEPLWTALLLSYQIEPLQKQLTAEFSQKGPSQKFAIVLNTPLMQDAIVVFIFIPSYLACLLECERYYRSLFLSMIASIKLLQMQSSVGVWGPEACNFINKETLAQGFSCGFCEISKSTFLTERLRWLLL